MRLIDADALYDRLECRYKSSCRLAHKSYGVAIDEVCDAPTITPESLVVHGKWEKSEIPCEEFRCSICGGAAWYYDVGKNIAKSRYCPTCGAKMDLEEIP